MRIKNIDFNDMEDKVLLEYIAKEQQKGFENEEKTLCPRCMVNHLDSDEVMNSTSRLNGDVCICNDCGNDEAFGEMGMFPTLRAYQWEIFKIQ